MMPPHDDQGVSTEAACVAFCAETRLLDAIKVGSVLLHREQLSPDLLDELLTDQPWRRGCDEARWVLPHLDERCRSVAEAELLAFVLFASLPVPEVNKTIDLGEDRGQYNADIDRYKTYRRTDTAYEQITKERMRSPKATVRQIHRALVDRGYDGPPPDFGEMWLLLFAGLSDVVRPGCAARHALQVDEQARRRARKTASEEISDRA